MIEARIGNATIAMAREITIQEGGVKASVGFYSAMGEVIPPTPRSIPMTPELQSACKALTELVERSVAAMVGAQGSQVTTEPSIPIETPLGLPPLARDNLGKSYAEGGEGTLQSFLGDNS